MIEIDIPGWRQLRLTTLVLDLNGTLALDGHPLPLHETIAELAERVDIRLLSADTYGTLERVAAELGVTAMRLQPGGGESDQKAQAVRLMGAESVAAIGNGANDVGMLELAALSVVVLGDEGVATRALLAADLVVGSADEALDLLLHPSRLVATLRR